MACSHERIVASQPLRIGGESKSCGCRKPEVSSVCNSTHRMSGTKVYKTFYTARALCTNPRVKAYPSYGGPGMKMEFQTFEEFHAHMGDPSPGPGWSLDRIDNDGNYAPGNLRWVQKTVQMNNVRTNRLLTYNGRTQKHHGMVARSGLDARTICDRLRRGDSPEGALRAPHHANIQSFTHGGQLDGAMRWPPLKDWR